MKKWAVLFIISVQAFSFLSADSIDADFRFISTFSANPYSTEFSQQLESYTLNGMLYLGGVYRKFTFGIDITEQYISLRSGEDVYPTGDYNILSTAFSMLFKINPWIELQWGCGANWLYSSLSNHGNPLAEYHRPGLSLLAHVFLFIPPWPYIQFGLYNRVHIYPSLHSLYVAYNGVFQIAFHPYVQWMSLFVECGADYLYIDNSAATLHLGFFTWNIGISFDMRVRKTANYVREWRTSKFDRIDESADNTLAEVHDTVSEIDDDLSLALIASLNKLENGYEGEKLLFDTIVFQEIKAVLLPQSYPVLDRIVVILKKRSTMEIGIGSYLASVRDPDIDMRRIKERSEAIIDYFIQQGIDKSRMKVLASGIFYGKNKTPKIAIVILKE